jgi:hypothetical protein
MFRRWCLLFACTFFAVLPGFAQQGSSGELAGTVTDASGAVIPGAEVVATDTATNISTKAISTSAGVYTFPALPPSVYKVVASRKGFRSEQVDGITLRVAQSLRINIKLQAGGGEETVTVSAQAELESGTAQIDHFVTAKEIETEPIPVTGDGERQLQDFIFKALPGTNGETYLGSINGGQMFSNEIYIDGISMGSFDTAEMGPSMEAVGEFNLQEGSMGAQYNGGGTAVSNFNIQSGTNNFHGSAYEYFQNEDLNANSYDANQYGDPRPKQRLNNFGGSFGGPVWIPKVYNGHNKTFFFFTYDQTIKRNFVISSPTSMPTQAMLSGDLSGFLDPAQTTNSNSGKQATTSSGAPVVDALGRPVIFGQIYDPSTQRDVTAGSKDPVTGLTAVSTGLVREPFVNNQIPTGRFDPVAQAYLKQPFPTNFINKQVYRNLATYASNQPVFDQKVYNGKLDQQITAAHRLSFFIADVVRDRSNTGSASWSVPGTNPLDTWDEQHNPGKVLRLSEYWTITPHISNHFGVGFNRFVNEYITQWSSENWGKTLGIENIPSAGFPTLSFSPTNAALGSVDSIGNGANGSGGIDQSTVFVDQVSFTHGRHEMQVGVEWRFYNENDENISGPPSYSFSNRQTDDGTLSNLYSGNAFASFLLGQVNSTARSVPVGSYGFRRREYAAFFQDNWKLNSKLSLNLGLRWVGMGGLYEVHGYMTNTCLTCPNPGASSLPGALQFASQMGKKGFEQSDLGLILPRFGFAYQPFSRWVWRGGVGVNTQSPEGNPYLQGNYTGGPSTLGYTGSIARNSSTNTQLYPSDTASFILSQPYPSLGTPLPDYDPTLANLGTGQGVPYHIVPNGASPAYTVNYTFGFQYDLGSKFVLEANYVGNTTKRLYAYGLDQLNALPYSDVTTYGDALGDALSLHPNVPTPYSSFPTSQSVAQALAPFPQYPGGGMSQLDAHQGWSRFDSLQATLTRHVSKGLNVLVAYTWSKLMTNTNGELSCYPASCGGQVQDVYNPRAEKAIALALDVPQQIKITGFYDLPFGRGRLFSMPYWLDTVAGGWTLSMNAIYQSGNVLAVSDSDVSSGVFQNIRPDYTGLPVKTKTSGLIVLGTSGPGYLNPTAFKDPPSTPQYSIALRPGTVTSALDTVVGPGLFDENFSLQKNFRFGEGRYVQVRADAVNAFNRAGLGNPYTSYYAGAPFGQILNPGTDSQNFDSDSYFYQPRVVQLSARIRF